MDENCTQEASELALYADRPETLSPETRKRIEAHLETCIVCRSLYIRIKNGHPH